MNRVRRNELKEANKLLIELYSIISNVLERENDSVDNVPDNLQNSERYENMEQNTYILDESLSKIDELTDLLAEII